MHDALQIGVHKHNRSKKAAYDASSALHGEHGYKLARDSGKLVIEWGKLCADIDENAHCVGALRQAKANVASSCRSEQ